MQILLYTGHRLNEYCTPEYSSPQLIAAITNLPAPVMDDAANDVWSLGVVLFQMLACTVPGPQVGRLLNLNPHSRSRACHSVFAELAGAASWLIRTCLWFQLAQFC